MDNVNISALRESDAMVDEAIRSMIFPHDTVEQYWQHCSPVEQHEWETLFSRYDCSPDAEEYSWLAYAVFEHLVPHLERKSKANPIKVLS